MWFFRQRRPEYGSSIYDFVVQTPEETTESEVYALTREDVLEACPLGDIKNLEQFKIPKGIEVVGIEAFEGAIRLKEIEFPEGLFMIQVDAFKDCRRLEKLQLPSTLQCIDDGAFMGCIRLEKLVIPEAVEVIGSEAFRGCTGLRILDTGGTAEIERQAFQGCCNLKKVYFGRNIRYVREYAFEGCRRLEVIRFPRKGVLRSLGYGAFNGTSHIKSIKLPQDYRRRPPYGELPKAFERSRVHFYARY